ncbi:MAG: pilus assembly protein PilM [Phycisphaerae bacterium]|nr:pilus assembly protein PilM [Phycisphaerae bacterium]
MLLNFRSQKICPIGVEITEKFVRMAQIGLSDGQVKLVAGGSEALPEGIEPYSGRWQRCTIEAVRSIYSSAPFKSRNVITAMLCADIYSKEIKKKSAAGQPAGVFMDAEIEKLLPFQSQGAMVRHIVLNENNNSAAEKNILTLAAEKFKVERHLAIFEKAGLNVRAITVWPVILVNSYMNFFGRRKTDSDAVVMLLNATQTECNAVICRDHNILFARTIPHGINSLGQSSGGEKLVSQIEACIRYFQSTDRTSDIEKILLFANESMEHNLIECVLTVAKKHTVSAHIGDVLKAVANNDLFRRGIDARDAQSDWTTAFGLSLSYEKGMGI